MSKHPNKALRGNETVLQKIPRAVSEHSGILVRIVDFDPNKHLVKVVKLSDNKPLLKDQIVDTAPTQKKRFEHKGEKVLKTSPAADGPIIAVNDDSSSIRGNADEGIYVFKDGGNLIKGKLSLATEPHNIRLSGLTTLNPLITSGFPSTIVTPIPATIWALPTAAIIKPILKDVLIMGTLVAAAGSIV